jgi:hypothetical protein
VSGVSRAITASAVAAALALSVTGGVAHADEVPDTSRVAACHWIDREYTSTYTCDEPADAVTRMQIIECWKFPAPARTYVRQKASTGWVRNAQITVKVTGARGCTRAFPYRTVVEVPGDQLPEMAPLRLRLTMPASSGVLPNGRAYTFSKTVLTYGACVMPADAGDWCPER